VAERAFADESDPRLRGLQGGKQQVAALAGIPEERVDRLPLLRRRFCLEEPQVH